jgi:N-methylhydantoinase A
VLGVDVGGTFTDCIRMNQGEITLAKIPTTQADPAAGVIRLLGEMDPGAVADVVHGTTVATNLLLERKGARTAFVTTAGFRDLLLIGRGTRADLYALEPVRPAPIVPEELTFEAPERIDADGWTVERLTADEAGRVARDVAALAPEAVAVCLLFSFLDDAHEVRLESALRRELQGTHISISSRVLPVFREVERATTTVVNAYVAPAIAAYLSGLEAGAIPRALTVMASHGGSLTPAQARALPAATSLSGPAAGVLGAWRTAERAGRSRVISFDMGGTSTDVALCDGGVPARASHTVGGFPVALPGVAIETVGAGGGSIVRVDAFGALSVGPESAGAVPGPAAYGRGGALPTVTDANVVLGRLPPDSRLGGALELDRAAAERALAPVAAALGLTLEAAALGAVAVVNAAMERALRVVSVIDGFEPRDFALVAFGGAGPLHACELAEAVGIESILIPATPGALSAVGLAISPRRAVATRSLPRRDAGNAGAMARILDALADQAARQAGAGARVAREVEARYRGQSWEIGFGWPESGTIEDAFHAEHERRFGYSRTGHSVEVVTLRAVASRESGHGLPNAVPSAAAGAAPYASATVLADGSRVEVTVIGRSDLRGEILGPAIVTQPDATTWIAPSWRARVGQWGDLFLTRFVT